MTKSESGAEDDEHYRLVEELVARVMQRKPDFVIHGGDHVAGSGEDDRDPGIAESWRHYHRLMDPIAAQCPL